jgi:hypothetical protein
MKQALPWLLGAALVVAAVGLYLWLSAPAANTLPEVYGVI